MQRAKQLADNIKERVKALGCNRHKIIVQVPNFAALQPLRHSMEVGHRVSELPDVYIDNGVWQVQLGQRNGQAVRVISRCLWDSHTDTAASASFESETMYCVCQASSTSHALQSNEECLRNLEA